MAKRVTLRQLQRAYEMAPARIERAAIRGILEGTREAASISREEFIDSSQEGMTQDLDEYDGTLDPHPPPGPLKSRSGKLKKSIKHVTVRKENGFYIGGIQAGSKSVPYARIHELGGQTKPHIIVPVHAKALAWVAREDIFSKDGDMVTAAGEVVFRQIVNHPGSKIPPRPYLAPAMQKAKVLDRVREEIRTAAKKIIHAVMGD